MGKKIVIFASGGGSNAKRILEFYQENKTVDVVKIYTNKAKAGVVQHADDFNVPCGVLTKANFLESEEVLNELKNISPDLIVLAGFLWLVPQNLIQAFSNKIINVHPALLPKFGGKGMYGHHVHKAVFEAKEKESGITIHFVNEEFDKGEIIFQAACPINVRKDSEKEIEMMVRALEAVHFVPVIDSVLQG